MAGMTALAGMLRRERRPGDLVFATAFMAFSLATLVLLPVQTTWVANTVLFAQPAFWPAVGVVMMVGFGAVHLMSSLVSARQEGRGAEVVYWLRSLEFVAWFLCYVWLVPVIGYLPATMLFAVLLTRRLGYRSAKSVFWAAAFGFAVVAVFKAGLQVKVPAGALYAYLPESIRTFMMVNF
ncbi:tripartite tricarboxylate transporter TctB family protein [Celeribacter sp. HF31]|uniref:tripartite tricarboxylate transporter TctB family protein n=1 Tax=Celeribacter sp. HF31 TaxID=2721558 RepID=UPI001431DE85|nr:tripartite tricarboxylate transporter TctB family protein [Celeribacter sp. HF31]NIY78160.1 tripartite tricarboxylate transporter TctB family protein [Celeribacter sp. HF31]